MLNHPLLHATVFLMCKEGGIQAKYGIALVDQSQANNDIVVHSPGPYDFKSGAGWGFSKLATLEELQPRFLQGDRLVLRGTVEVVR